MFGLFKRKEKTYKYRPCPECGATMWRAGGSGEVTEQFSRIYVKQYHKCMNCGLRMRLVRKLKSSTWSRTEHEAILTK